MLAKIENGMLFLIPENEQQRIEANKWYKEISKNHDEMSDFMVWVEQVPETFENYFKRLKQRRTEDEYKYTDEDFKNHIDYIEECWRNNLSVYKCLEFMYFETQSKKIKFDKTNIKSNIRSNSKIIEITATELRGLIFWASNGIEKSRGGSYYSTIQFIKNNSNLMENKNRYKNLVFGSRLENEL